MTQTFIDREYCHYIEVLAFWEGGINAKDLVGYFGFKKDKAKKILRQYCQTYPDNIEYNASKKQYVLLPGYQLTASRGHIDEYVQCQQKSPVVNGADLSTGFTLVDAPLREITPNIVRPILQAIKQKLRLDTRYFSVSGGDFSDRIISPHNLVFDGRRWHVRAYCEKRQDFRDFVLSRFDADSMSKDFEGPAHYKEEHDKDWNTWLELVIVPDARLDQQRQSVIAMDYQMQNRQRRLQVRAALLLYVRQRLGLDSYNENPEAQQIMIEPECLKRLKPYL